MLLNDENIELVVNRSGFVRVTAKQYSTGIVWKRFCSGKSQSREGEKQEWI